MVQATRCRPTSHNWASSFQQGRHTPTAQGQGLQARNRDVSKPPKAHGGNRRGTARYYHPHQPNRTPNYCSYSRADAEMPTSAIFKCSTGVV